MAIEIKFRRLMSPLSSILANPSSSASIHQTNHGLTEPVRDGEADDEKNGRWGQQRMEDGEDGGWRVDPIHGGGGGAPIHSRFGNKWATIARFHNGWLNDVIKNHWNSMLKRKHATSAIDGVKERGSRRGRCLQNLQIWKWDLGGGGCWLMSFLKFMGFVG
ncbi:hypothetical protein RHGRI_032694 [Rhododendron griersonianum]|uniref:Uncharacterized protein n=3 Tax=Rhododendron griersonianum TaxID=479676 RepID=A0AAV6IGB2_9ERIC|nr:hypothetical protein RHGRI_032694 [Rhododendron griersonianum]